MTRTDNNVSFGLSAISFLIYFLLKPFYLFGSGTLQLGDFFLLLSFAFLVYERKKGLRNDDYIFGAFLICVMIINFTYFFIYRGSDFLKSCLYYVFNYIVILCFREFMYDRTFQKGLAIVCKMNLLLQLAVFLLHKGAYLDYRYMGTYTDPNQMGFAVVSTLSILFLLQDKWKYLYLLVAAFLIIQTSSGGMLMALCILISLDCLIMLKKAMDDGGISYTLLFLIILGVGAGVILILSDVIHIDWDHFRITDKFGGGKSALQSFIDDRALNVAQEHPEYFLFGYGEGFQFPRYGYQIELHSTWISLCYYYGVIPFCILLAWIYSNIRHVKLNMIPVYCAIFTEAFTLAHQRQASFWMIILLANICCQDDSDYEYTDEIEIEEIKSA
ncbi:O-antigen ligase [Ruminococcus flavefaciens]|uniref:O-antigen ligase family protein n=1 Tax=Ruminococcus flavefaciens TaxID=1265 RepID=UPI0026EFEC95|nr:hypothetical protein [Ruminococcus flavefaciens]